MSDRRDLSEIEDPAANASGARCLEDVAEARYARRDVLGRAAAALTAWGALLVWPCGAKARDAAPVMPPFSFEEVRHGIDETHHVPPGYGTDILIRWGDPVTADAPPFDPLNQTPQAQAKQFGYNNDYLALLPAKPGAKISDRALLCVNHEYTNAKVMFPGVDRRDGMSKTFVDVEMAAHGVSVVEIERDEADHRQRCGDGVRSGRRA